MFGFFRLSFLLLIILLSCIHISTGLAGDLLWPINCQPNDSVCSGNIGYPDIDNDGKAFNCTAPGYRGHQGTDIGITWTAMDNGISVSAAASGKVLFSFDGKYDKCPNSSEPDCQQPPSNSFKPGQSIGYRVCTNTGPYCGTGFGSCYWCFDGGNVVVIKHTGVNGVFATRYDHLKRGSILVSPGDFVTEGQKIAEVGSAGHSTGPHLHFEVWSTGFYELGDPWAGPCGPNYSHPLWKKDPPWSGGSDNIATAIEFYHAGKDHYFNTANQGDIDFLEANPQSGWYKTGYSFKVYQIGSAPSGTLPVARYYGAQQRSGVYKPDSHFYTGLAGERQILDQGYQKACPQGQGSCTGEAWFYEKDEYRIYLPNGSSCPSGSRPVYRFYNNGYPNKDSNHRYTIDAGVAADMLAKGWLDEGVKMCVPN